MIILRCVQYGNRTDASATAKLISVTTSQIQTAPSRWKSEGVLTANPCVRVHCVTSTYMRRVSETYIFHNIESLYVL